MGTVYSARVEGDVEGLQAGTQIALKVVHTHLVGSKRFPARFLREIEIGKTVAHENVVRTYCGGEIDGRHFIGMEFVEGQTLRQLLDEMQTRGHAPNATANTARRKMNRVCRVLMVRVALSIPLVHLRG